MTKPITPKEVQENATKPDEIIEAFNELIKKYWDGKQSQFRQMEIVALIIDKMNLDDPKIVYDNHWLDVKYIYCRVGWEVIYDKPGYHESYPATFTFSKSE